MKRLRIYGAPFTVMALKKNKICVKERMTGVKISAGKNIPAEKILSARAILIYCEAVKSELT